MISRFIKTKIDLIRAQTSEHIYKKLFQNYSDAIVCADLTSKTITDCNTAAESLFGRKRKELLGQSITILHPPGEAEKCLSIFKQYKGQEEFPEVDTEIITKKGTILKIRIKTSSFLIEKQCICVGRFLNVTKENQMNHLIEIQRDLCLKTLEADSLSEIFKLSLDTILDVTDFDGGGIYLVDPDTDSLDLVYHKGLPQTFVDKVSHYPADSDNARIVQDGKPIYSKKEDSDLNTSIKQKDKNIKGLAVIPIMYKNQAIGCLNISSNKYSKLPDGLTSSIETIVGIVGLAISSGSKRFS